MGIYNVIRDRFFRHSRVKFRPDQSRILRSASRVFVLSFLTLVVATLPASGQKAPMKWGKIDKKLLEMNSFPQDTNAAAIILCDYGEAYFITLEKIEFKVHTRIKILKEAGYDFGTVTIPYYAKKRTQVVKDIKGQTYTLSDNGKVVKHKLDKKSIFTEKVSENTKQIKFTLPRLEPGAVIEYQYKIISRNPAYLPSWTFQVSEPTLHSEYRVWIPDYFDYVYIFEGSENPVVNETLNEMRFQVDGTLKRWVLKDVPALRKEPYITTLNDYRSRIRFQLSKVMFPGQYMKQYLGTWESLAEELLDSREFGKKCKESGLLSKKALAKIKAYKSQKKKIGVTYNFVRKTMKWNGDKSIFASDDLQNILKKRSGNSADLNFILISILRELGFDAKPVILSTRANGRPVRHYPLASQFNYVITYVKVGNTEYFLDPTDPYRPFTLLPYRALNGFGWLVDKTEPRWVEIPANGSHKKRITVTGKLSAEGVLQGQIVATEFDYSALDSREFIQENDQDEFINEYFTSEIFGAEVDSFHIDDIKIAHKPLRTKIHFSSSEAVQQAGEMIYLTPVLLEKVDENPFKLPHRSFPVDFAYLYDINYTLVLELPEGFVVSEKPTNIRFVLPKRGGSYQRLVQVDGNKLSVMSKLKINKTIFQPDEYKGLREFYDRIVSAQAEQVVIRQNGTESGE